MKHHPKCKVPSRTCYVYWGCRCLACTDANTAYVRAWDRKRHNRKARA